MAPFQVFFVRNLKTLYGRGSKKEEFAAIDAYFRSPNPHALILFVADHLRIPTDLRKMDYQDKDRYERSARPSATGADSSNWPASTRTMPSNGSPPPPNPATSASTPTPPAN